MLFARAICRRFSELNGSRQTKPSRCKLRPADVPTLPTSSPVLAKVVGSAFSVVSSPTFTESKEKSSCSKMGGAVQSLFVEDSPAIVEKYDCFRWYTTQRCYGRRHTKHTSSQRFGLFVGIHLVLKSTTRWLRVVSMFGSTRPIKIRLENIHVNSLLWKKEGIFCRIKCFI